LPSPAERPSSAATSIPSRGIELFLPERSSKAKRIRAWARVTKMKEARMDKVWPSLEAGCYGKGKDEQL